MSIRLLLRRAFALTIGALALTLLMAQGCPSPVPVFWPGPGSGPGPIVRPAFVDVLLVNESDEFIQPLFYADPRTLFDVSDILYAENLIDIGEPMFPGEVVTITLTCDDAGSLLADADAVELVDGTLLDSTLLRQGEHFFCGEEVIMYYEPLPAAALPVTVEVINVTSNFVDPFFWSDPGTLTIPEQVSIPANFVDLGPPLAPGEVVTITLDCIDAGTFLIDGDLLLDPDGALPSDNLLLLNEGMHFFCGDLVSFYYEVDTAGFFISADVNDVTIAP